MFLSNICCFDINRSRLFGLVWITLEKQTTVSVFSLQASQSNLPRLTYFCADQPKKNMKVNVTYMQITSK